MKLQLVTGACRKVHAALEEAMATGTLAVPAELTAHTRACPRCRAEYQELERLFASLRQAGAEIDLGPVPGVLDRVLSRTATEGTGPAAAPTAPARPALPARRKASLGWVLGQVAVAAVILALVLGTVTFGALKVNQAVSGVHPSQVLDRLAAPFRNESMAKVNDSR